MLRLIINMIIFLLRLFVFISGIVGGFLVGLLVLPIPGKTIFNKMARLPLGLRNLVDDSVELFGACFKLVFAISKDFINQCQLISIKLQSKIQEVNKKYSETASKDDSFNKSDEEVYVTQKR